MVDEFGPVPPSRPSPTQGSAGLVDAFRDLLASDTPTPSVRVDPPRPPIGWAILELLGHRREVGYLSEEKIAGTWFLRLTTPRFDRTTGLTILEPTVVLFSTSAVYAITPTTERAAIDELRPWIDCSEPVAVQVEGSDEPEARPCSLRRGHDGDHDPDLLSDLPF